MPRIFYRFRLFKTVFNHPGSHCTTRTLNSLFPLLRGFVPLLIKMMSKQEEAPIWETDRETVHFQGVSRSQLLGRWLKGWWRPLCPACVSGQELYMVNVLQFLQNIVHSRIKVEPIHIWLVSYIRGATVSKAQRPTALVCLGLACTVRCMAAFYGCIPQRHPSLISMYVCFDG